MSSLGNCFAKDKDVQAKLVYLFFKPKMDLEIGRIQVEKVFEELQAEIKISFLVNQYRFL